MSEQDYIKFDIDWEKSDPLDHALIQELLPVRTLLQEAGLIGSYPNGVGFGNLSIRHKNHFVISGSGTGGLKKVNGEHFAKVLEFDLEDNYVKCIGPIKASAESMTHGILYKLSPDINAAIHVHSLALWERYFNKLPTTGKELRYGSPELAQDISRLYQETDLAEVKCLVLGGHKEGLFSFGKNIEEASRLVLELRAS